MLLEFYNLPLDRKDEQLPELPTFPASFVGGRTRLRRFLADLFSSLILAWAEVPEADNEAVHMDSLKHRSEILEEGNNEVVVFEAYLEAGFWGIVPSLIAEVSLYFAFCPSQLTTLTWRTLMAIQVLGEFHGFSIRVHEVLYLYYLAPLLSKPGFYHLRSRDGAPLVEEPSRGLRGNYPFGDDWDKQYVFARIPGLLSYPMFWRTVDVSRPVSFNGEAVVKLAMEILRRFRGVAFPMSKEALCHSRIWGNVMRLSMSGAYDEYQKGKTRKRRPFYVPPARLAKTVSRATGFSSSLPGDAEASPSQDLEAGVH
ncbi:hypothetical protein Bca101_082834 [Brassica carinata]